MTLSSSSPQSLRILVVDDDPGIRKTLTLTLESLGHQVTSSDQPAAALAACSRSSFDLLFLDMRLGQENGLDYITRFQSLAPWLTITVMTAFASINTAVEAMRRGAADYLPKPINPEQLELLVENVAERRQAAVQLFQAQETLARNNAPLRWESDNAAMRRAVEIAQSLSQADHTPVLLVGEDGTGKHALARAIHDWSLRARRPFVAVSCTGKSEAEIRNELFGKFGKPMGRIEHANGGTLYLSQATSLSHLLQDRLVTLLADRTFEREGDAKPRSVDIRVIASVSDHWENAFASKTIRPDLFYAFNANQVLIPALRDRPEDIVPLAHTFLTFFARNIRRTTATFKPDIAEYLRSYPWPGNLRELRNVVERAVIMSRGERIGVEHLPSDFGQKCEVFLGDLVPLARIEAEHIRRILAKTNTLEAAERILQMDHATLWRRRKEYGL
jgi:two-component system, NtrC family, response regulator AlgB